MPMTFYFLRHGETDHNKYQIINDPSDVSINSNGIDQAREVRKLIESLNLQTLIQSPMRRVIETREIIFEDCPIPTVVVDEFKECSHDIWLNLDHYVENYNRDLSSAAQKFIDRIQIGLGKVHQANAPALVIAHGGTFWSICHHLNIQKNRRIPNCQLVKFFQTSDSEWDYCIL